MMLGMLRLNYTIMKEMHGRIFLSVLIICTALTFCTCDNRQNTDIPEKYSFSAFGVTFSVGDDCDEIIRLLGEPNSKNIAPSCADIGSDEMYIYSGFKIFAHRNYGESTITAIELTNDTVSTAEGIFIGDLEEKVRAIYGNCDMLSKSMEYRAENGKLRFYIRDGRVVSIKYVKI